MSRTSTNVYDHVGPVLQAGTIGSAVVAAIRDLNQDVLVMDRGAYLRVLVPGRCIVTREAIEKLLITYDWGESFVGLNLALKPLVDELFMKHLGDLGRREGDYMLGQIFYSLNEDCQWHRQWSQALVKMAIEDTPRDKEIIQGWINKWYPVAARAVQAFAPIFEEMPGQAKPLRFKDVVQRLEEYYREYLSTVGLQKPSSYDPVV